MYRGPEHRTDIPLTGCKNLYKIKWGRQNENKSTDFKKMHFLGVGGQDLKVIKNIQTKDYEKILKK